MCTDLSQGASRGGFLPCMPIPRLSRGKSRGERYEDPQEVSNGRDAYKAFKRGKKMNGRMRERSKEIYCKFE